ncbi:hypothetical protein BGZ99_005953 [Dissophora globulifera]|uniref:Uncharacterized protein n=1 Tax=Dissophora globulifera TaxID=979702 RepID=A0A9P6REN1_9FUNG|nr:hypothetical protein BGZ99_005953 [Dissophora globulifera]
MNNPTLDLYTPVGALVETIDLSMLPHRWDEIHIGHIQSLVAGCPFVSTLNLSTCLQLRDNAVQIIVEELGPRQLKSLVLSGCTRISDLAVLSICAHAARLENLELSACDRISDISVLELGSATVAWASDQSDSGTSQAGDHRIPGQDVDRESKPPQGVSRSIRSLDLSHCTRITDTGIRGLRMGATQLTSLNLEGCFGVVSGYDGLDLGDWEDLEDTDSEEDMGSDPGTASDQEEEH